MFMDELKCFGSNFGGERGIFVYNSSQLSPSPPFDL